MRILYFSDIRFPLERANGIQTMETCHALAARGHTVNLIVRPDTATPARDPFEYYGLPRLPRLVIERAPIAGPQFARRAGYVAFALGRGMGAARADIVMTRDIGLAATILSVPASLRPPLVYESHGYSPDVAAALPELVSTATMPGRAKLARMTRREARVWRDAEGYVTITAGLAEELSAHFGTRPLVAVIPDGYRAPDGATAAAAVAPSNAPVVAYAGHLYPWKGVDVLLEALARLPHVHGLIVGGHAAEPDLPRTKALASRLGLDERITFTGLVKPAEVHGYLRRADVLALPNPASVLSSRYTSPLKLFEYLAAGRPIVASDLPSIREVLHDGDDSLLVPPGDPDRLAAAIQRVLGDAALADRLAKAAQALAPEYGWDRRAERLEAHFAEVIASRGRAAPVR